VCPFFMGDIAPDVEGFVELWTFYFVWFSSGGAIEDRRGAFPLLLVVPRCARDLFSLRIGSSRSNRAAFAIGRDDDATGNCGLPAFLHFDP
jgi:hypothetical protein